MVTGLQRQPQRTRSLRTRSHGPKKNASNVMPMNRMSQPPAKTPAPISSSFWRCCVCRPTTARHHSLPMTRTRQTTSILRTSKATRANKTEAGESVIRNHQNCLPPFMKQFYEHAIDSEPNPCESAMTTLCIAGPVTLAVNDSAFAELVRWSPACVEVTHHFCTTLDYLTSLYTLALALALVCRAKPSPSERQS
jgi:hypothetical protein